LALDARGQGRGGPRAGARDGVQPQRLRRVALGRGGQERRGVDLQAVRAVGAAREEDRIPRLDPRAPPPAARPTDPDLRSDRAPAISWSGTTTIRNVVPL